MQQPTARLAYSTWTGKPPAATPPPVAEAHCFICRRHTDHFGEHDDLVDAGTARYDTETGSVYPV